ncbi:FAD binding domain-containing protein [uncultured Ramlibacter sp.]|uniref:FAD binding domain-containing protein n=1 Tax=uncultured Ramlibacter sp. TaxID=260755 RepID=UPI00262CF18F|nr:FAD binding domain-containing protein [uncultured Ramlibacter sp.]
MTTVEFPTSGADAQARRSRLGSQGAFVGGGTALQLAWDGTPPSLTLLDVTQLPAAQGIALADGGLRMGAAMRLEALRRDALVGQHAPLLTAACNAIAALPVRHLATLGGNVAWGFGDTLPVLLALGACAENVDGRCEPLQDWLERADGTLLIALRLDVAVPPRVTFFEKVGHRAAFSPSRISIALSAGQDAQERLYGVQVAVAGAGLRARRLPQVEQALAGVRLTDGGGPRLRQACAIDLAQAPALARVAAAVITGRLKGADHGE